METLLLLSHLTIVLLFGILFAIIAKRLRIPHMLLLLISGIFLGNLIYNGKPLIIFPQIFTNSIGILALVLVVFDASSRFKWKQFDSLTHQAAKISVSFLILNILFLTILTTIVFDIQNVLLALIFSTLMAGTSADVVLSIFKNKSNKITNLLEVESILNTPITVLLPFMILSVMQNIGIKEQMFVDLFSQFIGIAQQVVTGIGAGVIMGLGIFKIMRKYYSQKLSPLILITSTLLTYILAENLKGNGVLAVTVLGLFFGNLYVKKKDILFEFSSTFGNSLMILVFVLVGLNIPLPFNDLKFFLGSLILFAMYVAIRSMAVYISTMNTDYSAKEKIFLTLNTSKGIAVAVIVFTLLSYNFSNNGNFAGLAFIELADAELILNLSMIFMIYSLILSTVVNHFSKYFIQVEILNKKND
jgi:potassium/hydrogen antiporter